MLYDVIDLCAGRDSASGSNSRTLIRASCPDARMLCSGREAQHILASFESLRLAAKHTKTQAHRLSFNALVRREGFEPP